MNNNSGAEGFGQFGQVSPGGFVFGVQGHVWADPVPRCITFFLDNTAKVSDQYGRPIKGTNIDGKEVLFAKEAPPQGNPPAPAPERKKYATHAQVIEALAKERIDWRKLTCAGFPQLPYEQLKVLMQDGALPPTPLDDLRSIKDKELRLAALRARREVDEAREREEQVALEE